ncbi:hypothetical protein B6U90_02065 [Thermoplasmatales archaeon ex4484_6]|nr:MAG: hypothetical protein B6U90_02065 [Thermoplasmatales archaeon ex4484_6]
MILSGKDGSSTIDPGYAPGPSNVKGLFFGQGEGLPSRMLPIVSRKYMIVSLALRCIIRERRRG